MAKRVLVVSLRFPPHGGGGVHRVAHFVRHLPASGWHPHVLTGPGSSHSLRDPSLLDLIPETIPVTRTDYTDFRPWLRALGRLRLASVARAVTPSFPAMDGGWIPHGVRAGARILGGGEFDVVYSSAYPMSSHLVALRLKRRFGIPWVADYRDEWSMRGVLRWPTPVHAALARGIDRRVTAAADRVVTTSPVHTDSFCRHFPSDDPHHYRTVTNGFDAELFERTRPIPDRPSGFLLCHVGSLFEWRSAGAFVEAVCRLLERGEIPAERLNIRFVGKVRDSGLDRLSRWGVAERTGYVPHQEAVAWLKAADALLLINTEKTNILAKTFEYLASGRPVLALTREGPTADLLRGRDENRLIDPDDVEGIERALLDLYERWRSDDLASGSPTDLEARYSRRATAAQLAAIFDEISA